MARRSVVTGQSSPCGICVTRSGTGTGFSPSTLILSCQYHSTIAPYSLVHLPPALYNVFLPVLQFSPVSIIPPLLHTHSFIYHPRCIMFFSQHFSFPLSVSFHHCSILIFIYTLLTSEAATDEAWELSKMQCLTEKQEKWISMYVHAVYKSWVPYPRPRLWIASRPLISHNSIGGHFVSCVGSFVLISVGLRPVMLVV